MGQGIEIRDTSGKLTYSSEWGVAHILGSFSVTTRDGTQTISSSNERLFAYSVPFHRINVNAIANASRGKVQNAVWTDGNVIKWMGVDVGTTIVYGECFT